MEMPPMRKKIDSAIGRIPDRPFSGLVGAGLSLLMVFSIAGSALGQAAGGAVRGDLIGPPIHNPASVATAPPQFASTNISAAAIAKASSSDTAGFDKLAGFPFKVSDDMIIGTGDTQANSREIATQIPSSVKALNEKEVSITGFMLPTKVDDGKATEFLLLKNQSMCCYGLTPNLNEYVSVRLTGQGVKPVMDRLITVSGKLHVGEMRQSRLLVGLYQLEGDKVDASAEP
jgi:hypothetical protein